MILSALGFLHMGFVDILDIVVVGLIIFMVFRWIRGSSAMNIFLAIISLFLIKVIASALNMKLLTGLTGAVLDVGVIALIIIFQPEIRHFLIRFGSNYGNIRNSSLFNKFFGVKSGSLSFESIDEIVDACRSMSEQKTGALLVLANMSNLQSFIETGDNIDAKIESRLIQNLFFKNSPLHDGALIIRDNRLVAARCTLPNTEKTNLPARYGMRHKAAIGVTEESDAAVIVVSEQTGGISYVQRGEIIGLGDASELKGILVEREMKKE